MRTILLIMIGVSWLLGANTVVDKSSGLEWQDNSDVKSVEKSWEVAKSYCENLTLDGKSDWRLPSIKELQSIVDIKKYNPAINKGFNNVASGHYWSSSENVSNSSYAWGVSFRSGNTSSNRKSDKLYVRCVRGRQ